MWCTQRFSMILDGVVQNVLVCDNYVVATEIAQSYGEGAIAVDTSAFAIEIGDTYSEGKFYDKQGAEIKAIPTVNERISEVKNSVVDLESAACDLDEVTNQRITDIEDALCELAEIINTLQEGNANG